MRSQKFRDYSGSRYRQSNSTTNSTSRKEDKNATNKITNSKTMLAIMFIIFVIVLFFIMYINQYVQLSRKSLMVEKLEEKKRKLESKQEHLQVKIARLKSLDRVERIAKKDLNMEQPDDINYIVLDADKNDKVNQKENQKKVAETKSSMQKFKVAFNLEEKVQQWIKDLTTVQAGTLKEQ